MAKDHVDRAADRGKALFKSGYLCAESVLLAVAEWKGVESELIPRIATGFCSGLARSCNLCGAVSGSVMAIGLLSGRDSPEETVEDCYGLVQAFVACFEARFGSTNCQQLVGCDLNTERGQAFFREHNLLEQCAGYVEGATRMVIELVEDGPKGH
jgi:C_GCAxxG_C_C family probable redox protein